MHYNAVSQAYSLEGRVWLPTFSLRRCSGCLVNVSVRLDLIFPENYCIDFDKFYTAQNFEYVALIFRKRKSNRHNRFCCVLSTKLGKKCPYMRIHTYRYDCKLFNRACFRGLDRQKHKILPVRKSRH